MYLTVVKARPPPEAGNDFLETVDKFVRLHEMANVEVTGQRGFSRRSVLTAGLALAIGRYSVWPYSLSPQCTHRCLRKFSL